MHVEPVEIYSDASNAVVMRHPGRRFPGILVQGDTLSGLCSAADDICSNGRGKLDSGTYKDLNDLRNRLWDFLLHYKKVLSEHDISLPFSDQLLPPR